MASVNDQESRTTPTSARDGAQKASFITASAAPDATDTARSRGRRMDLRRADTRRRAPLWVDLILILLIVGAVVGCVMGYRALQKIYAPDWESREVQVLLEFASVDADAIPAYWNLSAPVYLADDPDAAPIGYVKAVPYIATLPTSHADGADSVTYKTFHVLISTTADYREGKGYFVGNTPLLAGTTLSVRVDGISSKVMILSVQETAETAETSEIAETAASETA